MLNFGQLSLDTEKIEVKINGKIVENLTSREFDVLKYLTMQGGQVVTREKLLAEVWGKEYEFDIRTLDITVRRIREKIEKNPTNPQIIKTKRGVGYYLYDEKGSSQNSNINTMEDTNLNKIETIMLWNEKISINTSYIEYYKLKQRFEEQQKKTRQFLMEKRCPITYEQTFSISQDILKKCEDDIEEIIKEFFKEKIYTERIENYKNLGYRQINRAIQDLISYQRKVDSQIAQEMREEYRIIDTNARRYNSWDYSIFGPMPGEKKKRVQRSS